MLWIIVITLLLSILINIFLKRFNIPTIIWYIATWVIITYTFWLKEAVSNHELKMLAEFWIVFLMFTIWLEFSVNHLTKMKKDVLLIWWLQFFSTSVVFYIISNFFLGFDSKTSIIISSWLSLSSTAIVLKLLNETQDISKEYGQKSLWILLFQDLAVIPIILLITIFSQNDISISLLVLKTLLSWIVLFLLLWIIWKYLIDPFLHKVNLSKSNEIFISAIFLIVMWASFLSHYLLLSYSLWALIAWMIIAETHYKHQVQADLSPFRDLLLWIFFITVWMQLDFMVIYENISSIAFLVFLVSSIKIMIIYMIIRFFSKKLTSLKTALSLFQVWEFALVAFELSSSKGLLSFELSQILIVVIIISMILTPIIIKYISFLSHLIIKERDIINQAALSKVDNIDVFLIGYGRIWKIISNMLDKDNINYLIVEKDLSIFKRAIKAGKPIILWNAYQKHLLNAINIHKAKEIIISLWNNEKLFLICDVIKSIAKDSKIIVKVNKYEEKYMLNKLDLDKVVVETEETAISMYRELSLYDLKRSL